MISMATLTRFDIHLTAGEVFLPGISRLHLELMEIKIAVESLSVEPHLIFYAKRREKNYWLRVGLMFPQSVYP